MAPAPAAPALSTPHTGLESTKLRSSCDGCGTAKVKCDRGHPVCGRCETLRQKCVYGPSQKIGKPPRKRLRAHFDASAERPPDNHVAASFGELRDVSAGDLVPTNFTDPFAGITPFSWDIDTALAINEENQLSSVSFPAPSLSQWSHLNNPGPGLEMTPPGPTLELLESVTPNSGGRQPHSCPRESYEIFRDLICPSPYLHAPESNSDTVSAQFDEVLHFNRNAIERLARVLECPCAKSGHRAMVHASIVSRVLIWYQQAAGWTGCCPRGAHRPVIPGSSTSCCGPSPSAQHPPSDTLGGARSLVQATGFVVEHVPVSVGTFSVEDRNVQVAFRNQVILSELRKTAEVIDMFSRGGMPEPSAGGGTGLASHLGAWLKSEHSRTVDILRSRLDVFGGDIEARMGVEPGLGGCRLDAESGGRPPQHV